MIIYIYAPDRSFIHTFIPSSRPFNTLLGNKLYYFVEDMNEIDKDIRFITNTLAQNGISFDDVTVYILLPVNNDRVKYRWDTVSGVLDFLESYWQVRIDKRIRKYKDNLSLAQITPVVPHAILLKKLSYNMIESKSYKRKVYKVMDSLNENLKQVINDVFTMCRTYSPQRVSRVVYRYLDMMVRRQRDDVSAFVAKLLRKGRKQGLRVRDALSWLNDYRYFNINDETLQLIGFIYRLRKGK